MPDRQRRPDRRVKSAGDDWIERERDELEQSFRAIRELKTTPRDRACDALHRAIEHFDFLGVSRDALAPLLEIEVAFEEGERGLLHPLFEPDKKQGRRRRPWAQVQQQRYAVLAMVALIRAGESKEQAARKVAKVLKRICYKFPSNSRSEWKTVAEWRDEVNRSLADKARKSEFYDDYDFDILWIDQEIKEKGKDPAEFAKQILGWLSAMRL
jgi:hypothetical protein